MKVDDSGALEAYFDGELSQEEAINFEKRLQAEPELRQELESFKRCSALISQLPKVKVPFDLTKSVLERAASESPSPFALADSPVNLSFLTDAALTSSDGESEQGSVSKESENGYVDDWQKPTIMQRISRAMLWPTMVIIIAIGLYLSNPTDNSAPIQTKPDDSEIADDAANNKPKELETSVPFLNPPADLNGGPMEETVQNDPNVVLLPANDTVAEDVPEVAVQAPDEVQYQIVCSVDKEKFNWDQWLSILKELGVETDESKAPLEVGVWTLSTSASQRAEALSALKSVPGVTDVQNKAVESVTPPAADISVLTEIRIQPVEK